MITTKCDVSNIIQQKTQNNANFHSKKIFLNLVQAYFVAYSILLRLLDNNQIARCHLVLVIFQLDNGKGPILMFQIDGRVYMLDYACFKVKNGKK